MQASAQGLIKLRIYFDVYLLSGRIWIHLYKVFVPLEGKNYYYHEYCIYHYRAGVYRPRVPC